jgi:ATP phosphoribosyltransferase
MNILKNKGVTRVFVPSGRDYQRCVGAFQQEFNVEVPAFTGRQLQVVSDGIEYTKIKGKNVPGYVQAGYADLGITGQDICEEQIGPVAQVLYRTIGSQAMCGFELMLPEEQADALQARLSNLDSEPLSIATSFPTFFLRCINRARLNARLKPIAPAGSVEIMPRLRDINGRPVCDGVADLVETGESAVACKLRRVAKLADVYPAIVWRGGLKTQGDW